MMWAVVSNCGSASAPQLGQLVAFPGQKWAVYEPMNAWPMVRRTMVEEAMREPPVAPAITGGIFLDGGEGRTRYAWDLSALCQQACKAAMVASLIRLSGGKRCVIPGDWVGRGLCQY